MNVCEWQSRLHYLKKGLGLSGHAVKEINPTFKKELKCSRNEIFKDIFTMTRVI